MIEKNITENKNGNFDCCSGFVSVVDMRKCCHKKVETSALYC